MGFSSAVRQMPGDLCTAPKIISLSPLSLVTDVTDATLGTSGLWLDIRTGAGGTATLVESFFGRSLRLHEQQVTTQSFSTEQPGMKLGKIWRVGQELAHRKRQNNNMFESANSKKWNIIATF